MANDIITNQVKTDAAVTSPVVQTKQANAVDENSQEINTGSIRQELPVEEGKALPSDEKPKPVSNDDLKQAVVEINKKLQAIERDLMFKVDEDSGITVVSVFNTQTDELVRKIPNDDVLRISKNIQQQLGDADVVGIILETSA